MGSVLDLAERYLHNEVPASEHHPFTPLMQLEEMTPDLAFISSFANVAALSTDEGLILFDTGSFFLSAQVHASLRQWSKSPVHTAVFTHGHVDHVFGVDRYEEEARTNNWHLPKVLAHRAVTARFDRYKATRGYNSCINARQFRTSVQFPENFRYPDRTYDGHMRLQFGDEAVELHHARGETDDHTWSWIPRHRAVITGDLFIWASPNAGNPQKVQRYPREWATALKAMAELRPEILLPGHGLPITGEKRVRAALLDTAELLDTLVDQVVAMMNNGATLDAVIHHVKAPRELLEKPYLRPVYDEPEFIVRNVWRLYGGWYNGNPAQLKPPAEAALANEIASLAGGASKLAERAEQLSNDEDDRLACQLIEYAVQARPSDSALWKIRQKIYQARAERETSLMAKGIFETAAGEKG